MPDQHDATEKARLEAAQLAAGATVAAGVAAVERAANGALDAVERLLFGKVGGAEEALADDRREAPLDRLRRKYGPPGEEVPSTHQPETRPDPEAEARSQLAALKAARDARAAAPAPPAVVPEGVEEEVKKTL